ncbi:MAG: DUF1801 domain-containing protein [Chloroflexi bacterium]|nr:MAG: DUF1801 domain-containing protein [Chloroflexota bacterium]
MTENEPPALEPFLMNYSDTVRELARSARVLILAVMPKTVEQLDPSANLIAYGLDHSYKGLICGITLHKAYINIMFAQGASLPDPQGLLQGTGKLARHVHVERLADLEAPGIRDLMETAFQRKTQ